MMAHPERNVNRLKAMRGDGPLVAKRWRAYRTPKRSGLEIQLHMATAELLRRFCRSDWQWTHFPAGEDRDERTGEKLRRMGVMRGWPDLQLVSPVGLFHGLELKRRGAPLSPHQEEFQAWCRAHHVPYAVARTIEDVHAAFDAWGCLRLRIGGLS